MASLKRATEGEIPGFEVFDLELSEDELSELYANPPQYLRELLDREGRQVNRLVVDTRLGEGDCACGIKIVHSIRDDWTKSSHFAMCVLCT
ncbi:hypothetical protein [Streptomyces hesseae]|uniref:Uncharacterized protein n=1 Tax=Streptomyces hesseae TaxID=3075519 RepID=A0ABU2SMW8_9ACTN|nr:hypothetical protein [Streptomyces sp. DSM 40473]MDT0449130.1 hypothetical protein [Streptomyces sp. DSM 40473]